MSIRKFIDIASGLLNERAISDTPEFKQWFNGTKMVDQSGNPIIFYHGTSNDIDFKTFKINRNGAWFTGNKNEASEYALNNDNRNNITAWG